jgi:hypothetical protein
MVDRIPFQQKAHTQNKRAKWRGFHQVSPSLPYTICAVYIIGEPRKGKMVVNLVA